MMVFGVLLFVLWLCGLVVALFVYGCGLRVSCLGLFCGNCCCGWFGFLFAGVLVVGGFLCVVWRYYGLVVVVCFWTWAFAGFVVVVWWL